MPDADAMKYISELNPVARDLAASAHRIFAERGCSSYVKTIYIGYDLDGVMVGALYGHVDHLEVALALPEDAEGSLLVDGSHLTWRTLPIAAIIRDPEADLPEFKTLVEQACDRVLTNEHKVHRDNEFFHARRRKQSSALADQRPEDDPPG